MVVLLQILFEAIVKELRRQPDVELSVKADSIIQFCVNVRTLPSPTSFQDFGLGPLSKQNEVMSLLLLLFAKMLVKEIIYDMFIARADEPVGSESGKHCIHDEGNSDIHDPINDSNLSQVHSPERIEVLKPTIIVHKASLLQMGSTSLAQVDSYPRFANKPEKIKFTRFFVEWRKNIITITKTIKTATCFGTSRSSEGVSIASCKSSFEQMIHIVCNY